MKRVAILVLLVSFFSPFVTFAAETEVQSETGLHALLGVYGGLPELDFWFKIPSSCGPVIRNLDKVYIGQKHTGFAIFWIQPSIANAKAVDSGVGDEHPVNLTYSFTEITPDGTSKEIIRDHFELPSAPQCMLVLPNSFTGYFEPGDAFGKHKIKLKIKDTVTKEIATKELVLELKPWVWPTGKGNTNDITEYYKNFDPDKLHNLAFSKKIDLESWDTPDQLNAACVSFLKYAYQWHGFLLNNYRTEFKIRNSFERKRILFLFSLTGVSTMPDETLTDDERVYQKKLDTLKFHDPYESLETAADLDWLWGEFFATGSYKPIRRLLDALQYSEAAKITDKYLADNTKPATAEENKEF